MKAGWRNPKKGASLLEMVLVLAIIAILMSMLLPVFAKAIMKAKSLGEANPKDPQGPRIAPSSVPLKEWKRIEDQERGLGQNPTRAPAESAQPATAPARQDYQEFPTQGDEAERFTRFSTGIPNPVPPKFSPNGQQNWPAGQKYWPSGQK